MRRKGIYMSRLIFTSLLTSALLAGCSSTPIAPSKGLSYLDQAPLSLSASSLEIQTQYQAPQAYPNRDHEMPIPPQGALAQWARDRLQTNGAPYRAVLYIEDASLKETKLPKTPGVRGVFTVDQSERYDISLKVRLALKDQTGVEKSSINAMATGSKSVPEDISMDNRVVVWTKLLDEALNALDGELSQKVPFMTPGL